ncbi:MAG TPA: DUF1440 domain-containing protein [Gaiellaceae bacterium]|jgi:hypothetical protein|nr:DUF1440 domain-containing protein [Gaiellaceae bacterium]
MADARTIAAGMGRGVLAGVAGTAVMTAYQLAVAKARGKPLSTPVPRTWAEAPAPAQVAKRAADALGKGRKITKKQVPLLTNVLHWGYGIGWGAVYGGVAAAVGASALEGGLAFGTGVWAASYGELVPLGIYKPPWAYPAEEVALDLSYHLVYGVSVAGAYAALR